MTYKQLFIVLGVGLGALALRLTVAPVLGMGTLLLVSGLGGILALGGTLVYLQMLVSAPVLRWRLRYTLTAATTAEELEYLEQGLRFLLKASKVVTIEASAGGLYLEVPQALREYAQKLIPEILPGGRLVTVLSGREELTTAADAETLVVWETKEERRTFGERWPLLAQFPVVGTWPLPEFLTAPSSPLPPTSQQTAVDDMRYYVWADYRTPGAMLASEVLTWGLEHDGRVRVQLTQGLQGIVVAALLVTTNTDDLPVGAWRVIPAKVPARLLNLRLVQKWSIGRALGAKSLQALLPRVTGPSVYSTESELFHLAVPEQYQFYKGYRGLGFKEGQLIGAPMSEPLWTLNAPPSFLQQQIMGDVRRGCGTVVLTPYARVLSVVKEFVQAQRTRARGAALILDLAEAETCGRLPIMTLDEVARGHALSEPGLAMEAMLELLAEYDIDKSKPELQDFARYMILAGMMMADVEKRDFGYVHFLASVWGVNRLTQTLRSKAALWAGKTDTRFAGSVPYLQRLTASLDDSEVQYQVTAYTNALRTVLMPVWTLSTLNKLVTGPFVSLTQVLLAGGVVGCVLSSADYPEHDRLLRGMFEATVLRIIRTLKTPIAVHLHEPSRYSSRESIERWLELQRQGRISLVVNSGQQEWYSKDGREFRPNAMQDRLIKHFPSKILFNCPEPLALHIRDLADEWGLQSLSELTELGERIGLARLPYGAGNDWFVATVEAPQ